MSNNAHPVTALPIKANSDSSMGSILLEMGKLKSDDVERVLHLQNAHGLRFGEAARRLGLVAEADIQQVLARQFDYHYLQPGQGPFPPQLVAAYQPFDLQVESFRAVRTQLLQNWFTDGRKALVVAGVNQGDGASFFAANLAVVFSQVSGHTLLVDANLRRPRQHEIFALTARQGLSDLLARRTRKDTCLKIDAFPRLSVLPAGTRPPNPQELLCSHSYAELSDALNRSFDTVLIDAPSFSSGADPIALAEHAGGILLVCRKNKTLVSDIESAKMRIERAGIQLVGSVLVGD